jgi:hypothetical protein
MLGSFDRPADGSDRTLTPVPKVPDEGRVASSAGCPNRAVPGRATVASTRSHPAPLGSAEHSAIVCLTVSEHPFGFSAVPSGVAHNARPTRAEGVAPRILLGRGGRGSSTPTWLS